MRWGTLCLLAVIAAKPGMAVSWIRLSSPPIEIITDNGERTARAVLHRFQLLQRVFDESHIGAAPAPLRVFIFSVRSDFIQYEPDKGAAAFYQSGDDRDFIVIPWDAGLTAFASHEFLHRVMRHASAPLPSWLSEGIPEFYSTLTASATQVHIGGMIESRLATLARERWLSAEDLALGSHSDGPVFYAESWALVHMLSLAPQWKNGMPEFIRLLNDGQDQRQAFPAAFGKSMEDALAALHAYLRAPKSLTVPVPHINEIEPYRITRLAPVEVTLSLANLALNTGHATLARTLFLEAAKKNPGSPAAIAGLGDLALAENRTEDAQRELERAVAAGFDDAHAYLELASLKHDDLLLQKALVLDPQLSEAHFLLGTRETDRGNFASAIAHLRQAVTVEPTRFSYWNALGYAQAKSGDRHGAADSARRAAILASNAQEEHIASALALLEPDAPSLRARKPDVITPPSWQNRKGDAKIDGTLTRVDCDSQPVKLAVSASGNTLELDVKNPSEVVLLNAEGASTTLACGEQSLPVAIEYVAATREITRIEFKHVIMKR